VTGDLIADGASYLDDVTDFFSGLHAREGVFASLGNHDYYGTVDGVPQAARDGGATVLRNAGTILGASRGASLFLAALDDSWSHRDDLARALAERPTGAPCVLLAHDPDLFRTLADRGDIDLVLSGHTHGGQFAIPFLARQLNLARLRHAYNAGLYHRGRSTLYVHRGNGTSGPAARLGAAPEIVALTLRCARAA
jgi:predicted MPP superfamily phosphohydrolase